MRALIIISVLFLSLASCMPEKPKPIALNTDACEFCKMTISNGKFGAEIITKKGRVFKFDDLGCMVQFSKSQEVQSFYVSEYLSDNQLIPAETAHFIKGEEIGSPMRGNFAAFASPEQQDEYAQKLKAKPMSWTEVYNSYP